MTQERGSKIQRVTAACSVGALIAGGIVAQACGGDDSTASGIDGGSGGDATFDSGGDDSGSRDSGPGDSAATDSGVWCGTFSDGGALCTTHDWENTDAGACNACPSPAFMCAGLATPGDGGAGASPYYDQTTRTVITRMVPGTAQIVSGTVTIPRGECSSIGTAVYADGGTETFPLDVQGDTLVTPPINDGGFYHYQQLPCGVLTYTLTDACCTTHVVQATAYTDTEIETMTNAYCDAGQ